MTVYEALSLMIGFGTLIVTSGLVVVNLVSNNNQKK